MRTDSLGALSFVLCVAACEGADHDALVARDAATGGSGGSILDGGSDVVDEADARPMPDAQSLDGEPPDSSFVPDGPSVFTFVHGVPNSRAIRVCFDRESAQGFEPMSVAPLPDDPAGLDYGRSFSADTLDGIDLEASAVRPVIYGGELDGIAGAKCDELETLPSGVVRAQLPSIPAGTLARERSVLMVAVGCFGVEPSDAGDEQDVCGPSFSPPDANATLLMASMERTPIPGSIGIQVFPASAATETMTVDHVTAFPSKTTTLVKDAVPGQIAPRPPDDSLSVANLGTSADQNTLRVFTANAAEPVLVEPLPDALERGGLSLDVLEDGENYTVVVVGPRVGMEAGSWFKSALIAVVPSSPK